MNSIRTLAVSLLLCTQLIACGDSASPEEQVRAVIMEIERAAEARDVGEVKNLLSPQYRDAYGNDPDDIGQRVRGYFVLNQSIHLLTRIQELSFPSEDEARATVLVGMVGRDADSAHAWELAADVYEFDIALLREGDEWKVNWAEWRRD